MIKIEVKRWYLDSAFYRHACTFFKGRVWFGWWWASICSEVHKDGYLHKCPRCRAGGWTRTRDTLTSRQCNSRWAFGKKIYVRYD